MPVLTIHHVTTYRYRHPVSFDEHRMMLRPREGHGQRLLDARLVITPEPSSLRWTRDMFGNHVAYAGFRGRAQELCFDSTMTLDHQPSQAPDFPLEDHAEFFPFTYGADEMPDLSRLIERQRPDPRHEVDRWVREFLQRDGATRTRDLLITLNQSIRRSFTYVAREEKGIQDPAQTIRLGSGSCRDFAMLMMEAVRALGLAARFVSGYLHTPRHGEHVGGGATHAWLQIYLPGPGWVEFDPTNGIVGNRDLIRVAVVREPAQAVPLSGSWTGFPADSLGMTVEVTVSEQARPTDRETAPRAAHQ
jgi:transglutaminase-like putative cysteine protease